LYPKVAVETAEELAPIVFVFVNNVVNVKEPVGVLAGLTIDCVEV
jgi:hypothetical protein